MSTIETTVAAFLQTLSWQPGDGCVLAVSGGPDSMVLLHTVVPWCLAHDRRVTVAHVHHGLRTTGDRDVAFVQAAAEALGVPLEIRYEQVADRAREHRISIEEAGRRVRYDFFERVRSETDSRFVMTGHHKDDQVETVLLHILRGAGIEGLRGMLPERETIVRPLLPFSKTELKSWLEERTVGWCFDEMNADAEPVRNRLRYEVIPLLRSINPAVDDALLRLADNADDAWNLLAALPVGPRGTATTRRTTIWDKTAWRSAQPFEQRFWIRRAVQSLTGSTEDFTSAQAEELRRFLSEAVPGSVRQLSRLEWRIRQEDILVCDPESEPARIPKEMPLPQEPSTFRWGGRRWTLSRGSGGGVSPDALWLASTEGVVLRTRRGEDRIRPFGMEGTQSIARAMKNLKIPWDERDSFPLVCKGDEVLWIPGRMKSELGRIRAEGTGWVLRRESEGEGRDGYA